MSLGVHIVAKIHGDDIDYLEKEIEYPHNSLFGFESYRKKTMGPCRDAIAELQPDFFSERVYYGISLR